MKSPIVTKEKIETNLSEEILQFGLKVGTTVAALIGLGACCALVAALSQFGLSGVLRGYVTAITGF